VRRGLGRGRSLIAVGAILAIIALLRYARSNRERTKLYLSVDIGTGDGGEQERIDSLNEVIGRHTRVSDLRRVDARDGRFEATYFVDVDGSNHVAALIDDLKRVFPGIGVSFIDQSRMPSV